MLNCGFVVRIGLSLGVFIAAGAGCRGPQRVAQQSRDGAGPAQGSLTSLADSLDPLRERFNADASKPRVVAIISSTCGACVAGAVAVNEAVLKAFPGAEFAVSVVWIDILPSDNHATARRATAVFDDPRVTQFHDPRQRAGAAFADDLLRQPPAWDIYLFYSPGQLWQGHPPTPHNWTHQLGGRVAEESRYRTGAALAAALHESMINLGFRPAMFLPPNQDALDGAKRAAMARIDQARRSDAPDYSAQEERCQRCASRGTISQCSLAGWRRIVAMASPDDGTGAQGIMIRSSSGDLPTDPREPRSGRVVELRLAGMACPDCTLYVAGALMSIPGVRRVEVDFDAGRVGVTIDPPEAANTEQLIDALQVEGYEAEVFKFLGPK